MKTRANNQSVAARAKEAREAMMGSPVHRPKDRDAVFRPKDLDGVMMYAPPWARKTAPGKPTASLPLESPPTSPVIEDDEPIFVGDRAMLALRRQLSLDPEIVPVPPAINGGSLLAKMVLRLCIVAAVAALGAWASASWTSNPSGGEIAQNGSAPAPITTSVKLVHVSGAIAPLLPTAMALPTLSAAFTTRNEPRPEMAAPAVQQPSKLQLSANTVVLGVDEIAMLLKRGKADLMDGDISAARLLLQRAAEAGNAEAALALGSTFDPLVIAQLGAFGVQADAAKAREWYQKAAALGSNLASAQLAKLAHANE